MVAPEAPNWADVTAAAAATIGAILTVGVPTFAAWRRHQAQMVIDARRLNDGMCILDIEFHPVRLAGDLQLDVRGLWPPTLFLLPDEGAKKQLPDGGQTTDAEMRTRKHIGIWMGRRQAAYVASAHVWSLKPFKSALLLVSVIERTSGKRRASRLTRINPLK